MTTTLERTIPVYHFRERHSWLNAAPPASVWQALASLTMHELTVTRPLLAVRHLGRHSGDSTARPLLTDGPVTLLDVDPPRYAIGGAVSRPWKTTPDRHTAATLEDFAAFDEPGWVKYLTDFDLTAEGGGTRLRTETRGYSTDDRARRLFRAYWAAIRLPSGLVRADVLRSVGRISTRAIAFP